MNKFKLIQSTATIKAAIVTCLATIALFSCSSTKNANLENTAQKSRLPASTSNGLDGVTCYDPSKVVVQAKRQQGTCVVEFYLKQDGVEKSPYIELGSLHLDRFSNSVHVDAPLLEPHENNILDKEDVPTVVLLRGGSTMEPEYRNFHCINNGPSDFAKRRKHLLDQALKSGIEKVRIFPNGKLGKCE